MGLIDIARNLWLQIRNETVVGANTAIRVGDAGSAILDAIEDANKTIIADDLSFFDTFLNVGFFKNMGDLGGTYSCVFNAPYLRQRVDSADKIYIRSIDVSIPDQPKPTFTIYGTTQPATLITDTEEIRLVSMNPVYTVSLLTTENVKISSNADGTSVAFPVLITASKYITFVIPTTSNAINFNGILIPAGNTVFCIFNAGVWTINSTIVTIPVIPNYSDVSVQHKVDVNVSLAPFTGLFISTLPLVLGFSKSDIILLSNQTTKSEIGLYQILFVSPQEAILKLIASGVVLNTIRVESDGVYQNKFDGFDENTISFSKIGTGGTSVPMNFSFFKSGVNGIVPMTTFSWITDLVVSQVILQDFATDISVTVNGTTYNKNTLIGISLPIGTKMTGLDMTIQTGYNTGNVIIIF